MEVNNNPYHSLTLKRRRRIIASPRQYQNLIFPGEAKFMSRLCLIETTKKF